MANSESAKAMRAAAITFLEAAPAPAARRPFVDEAERRNWHYVPRRREGLSLADMDAAQERAAFGLLASGLSVSGYTTATAVVALEEVLDRIEGGARHRHRRDYSLTVFGDPVTDAASPWGWRFEGHHVSVNATVAGGDVALAPLFLGANPAEVVGPTGHPITRPLAAEEDVALHLVGALSPAQRDEAFVSDSAPDDILTEAAPRLDEGNLPERAGVRLADLRDDARALAEALVRLYVDRGPADVARSWWSRIEGELGDVHLAFAGSPAHRRPHYYRLFGPSLLVEYDNTQDDANHVHTVLRDPTGDFGDDLLRAHRHDHH
jgi:hypothetical protein